MKKKKATKTHESAVSGKKISKKIRKGFRTAALQMKTDAEAWRAEIYSKRWFDRLKFAVQVILGRDLGFCQKAHEIKEGGET